MASFLRMPAINTKERGVGGHNWHTDFKLIRKGAQGPRYPAMICSVSARNKKGSWRKSN